MNQKIKAILIVIIIVWTIALAAAVYKYRDPLLAYLTWLATSIQTTVGTWQPPPQLAPIISFLEPHKTTILSVGVTCIPAAIAYIIKRRADAAAAMKTAQLRDVGNKLLDAEGRIESQGLALQKADQTIIDLTAAKEKAETAFANLQARIGSDAASFKTQMENVLAENATQRTLMSTVTPMRECWRCGQEYPALFTNCGFCGATKEVP